MTFTYTNRKGYTYYLCQGKTKKGKVRYYFSREAQGELVDQIPEGYRISESVNGIVSLVKDRPPLIAPEEMAAVEAALDRHPKGRDYRVAIHKNQIVIYERLGPDVEKFAEIFEDFSLYSRDSIKKTIQEELDKTAQFSPIMRFILVDRDQRIYRSERWCFMGSVDDWIHAGMTGKVDELAQQFIPLLGTDGFFDLF